MATQTKVKEILAYTTSNTHLYESNTAGTFSSDWYETREQMESFASHDLLEVVKCGLDNSIVSSAVKFEYL